MKRLVFLIISVLLLVSMCACSTVAETPTETAAPTPTAESTATAKPTATAEPTASAAEQVSPTPTAMDAPQTLTLPAAAENWSESYLAFLDDNYDIIAALWPEGLTGVGFIDLDLDGTPEMVLFDLGASATLGVQLFDLIDGQVHCVSSVLDSAAGAFGAEHFSTVSVCTSYFESFRLIRTDAGYCFWVDSANGTLESSWDEIVRFDCANGALTPVSVCGRYTESDVDSGLITTELYTVAGVEADAAAYEEAAAVYTGGTDTGYEAAGVFLWSDMNKYDTSYEGLMAMAADAAAAAYVPIPEN